VPANERKLGMVFQSYAIWPHMSVFNNVAFPLQVMKRASDRTRARSPSKYTGAGHDGTGGAGGHDRRPKLSGGQQQRLALARALVVEPSLLLLDEPLSNLDAKLRESLRYELKRLQRELGITSIYVTHDQTEALVLSNTVAVMKAGNIIQLGRPREIYQNPNSRFVAEFIGTTNMPRRTVDTRTASVHGTDRRRPAGTGLPLWTFSEPGGRRLDRPERWRVHLEAGPARCPTSGRAPW